MTYEDIDEAPDVTEVAASIAAQFDILLGIQIKYLFTDRAIIQGGKLVLAQIQKTTAVTKYLTNWDYIVIVFRDAWDNATKRQREALIFHELSHCSMTPKGVLTLRAHDIEEFVDVADKFGPWKEDLQELQDALEQYRKRAT